MTSLLKPKNIRRIIVGLALLAPIVYLFGSQIAALAGAHGEDIFAEPVYTEEWVEVDNFSDDGSEYRLVADGSLNYLPALFPNSISYIYFDYSFNGRECSYLQYGKYQGSSFLIFGSSYSSSSSWVYNPVDDSERFIDAMPWVFYSADFDPYFIDLFLPVSKLYKSVPVPTDVVAENNSAYTLYLFGNMFGKSNFLIDWGSDALSVDRHGFAPVGELFSYVDDNVLHLADSNIGLMGYGYMYYVVHVLLLDLVAMAFVFIVSIPERILDQINGKTGGDW